MKFRYRLLTLSSILTLTACTQVPTAQSGSQAANVEGNQSRPGAVLPAAPQAVAPQPPIPTPISTPRPTSSPSAQASPAAGTGGQSAGQTAVLAPPAMPLNLQVVEQGSSYLTLKWEFAADAGSYRLYLDGVPVVAEHVTPDYYRYTNLEQGRTYRLGVSAVGPGGESETATLSIGTIQGRSASGNFSSSGSGGTRRTASPAPAMPELRVNSFTATNQTVPAVAADGDGDFVVVWDSVNQDGEGYGVYGQRYDRRGRPQGDEFRLSAETLGDQSQADVAMNGQGDFVAVWMQASIDDGDQGDIYGQRYDQSGEAQGSAFLINTFTDERQSSPELAMDGAGNFVVTWQSFGQDGDNTGIYAQRFNAAGQPQGLEIQVSESVAGDQASPDIDMDAEGDFVIVWHSQGLLVLDIFARRFSSTGVAQGPEFLVNSFISGAQLLPEVAVDSEGNFVVAWTSQIQDGDGAGVFARRFDSSGVAQGPDFQVTTQTVGQQGPSSLAGSDGGDFIVTWESEEADDSNGIYAQRFDSSGEPQGEEFRLNTATSVNHRNVDVACDGAGNFVASWEGFNLPGDTSYGILALRLDAEGGIRPTGR